MNYKLSSVTDSAINGLRSLVLGKILDPGDVDQELLIANGHGFVGCLSSVRFNWIAPLKAGLRHSSPAPVQVRGRVVESDCRSPIATEPVAVTTTTLSLTDHTKPSDGEEPSQNAVRSDTAVIGGVIAVTVFVVLCLLAISGRLLYQRKGGAYRESQSKAAEYSEPTAPNPPHHRANYPDPMSDGRREFFI
ncbi:contactin-associated protein-like 5 [Callorhinchus milii]|uniref:contactin-associated protein-like 5 n=1 Tax=Callorhinchus milii TaxID=7868 RepID=UPI001C3FD633|nr:contactin-associated protein-like 5 [Callorhinchus milii]